MQISPLQHLTIPLQGDHSGVCSVPCHLEIGLMQRIPGRFSPPATPATYQECSSMTCSPQVWQWSPLIPLSSAKVLNWRDSCYDILLQEKPGSKLIMHAISTMFFLYFSFLTLCIFFHSLPWLLITLPPFLIRRLANSGNPSILL